MPFDKVTRYHIELAIVCYLKSREAKSEEIHMELKKRNYRVAPNLTQVVAICSSMKRKGALFARSVEGTTYWRINPRFYADHPGESMFTEHTPMIGIKEYYKSLNRRTWKSPKKRK